MSTISDPTDWLTTPLSSLSSIDAALRCQICKDFYMTPMMTSCSHTFCSLCIRRYLSQEGKCPSCREGDQEIKLRRNWVVEEIVAGFVAGRDQILGAARELGALRADGRVDRADRDDRPEGRRKRLKPNDYNLHNTSHPQGVRGGGQRATRSQSRKQASLSQEQPNGHDDAMDGLSKVKITHEIRDSDDERDLSRDDGGNNSDNDSVYSDPQSDATTFVRSHHRLQPRAQVLPNQERAQGLVMCPICNKRMKESVINAHLDSGCQEFGQRDTEITGSSPRQSDDAQPASVASMATTSHHFRQQQRNKLSTPPIQPHDRLPTLNYSLFTGTALGKKLRDLGIPAHGSKPLMQRRHTEWVNLWNSNCDSQQPVSKRDLLRILDTWERTQGRQIEKGGEARGVMVKDFDRGKYMRENRDEFSDLVRQARARAKAAKVDCGKVDDNNNNGNHDHGDDNDDDDTKIEIPVPAEMQLPLGDSAIGRGQQLGNSSRDMVMDDDSYRNQASTGMGATSSQTCDGADGEVHEVSRSSSGADRGAETATTAARRTPHGTAEMNRASVSRTAG